jgi:hypothetical protein
VSYERYQQPLLSRRRFYGRLFRSFTTFILLLLFALTIGTLGYHFTARLDWLDAFLNASMILTGMGPVDHLTNTGAKWFASIYAIFSGVMFLTSVGVLMAPVLHRFLHRFHLEEDDDEEVDEQADRDTGRRPRLRKPRRR